MNQAQHSCHRCEPRVEFTQACKSHLQKKLQKIVRNYDDKVKDNVRITKSMP